jgi:nucleoside-diphosphate-sugar epimerase
MPKVLITGGAGFVGRHFTKALLNGGFDVHVVDSLHPGSGAISPTSIWPLFNPLDFDNFYFYEMDCRNYFDENEFTYYDLVIHLAAVVGGRLVIENNPLAVGDDLSIDSQFWKWALKSKPGYVISFSSSAAYPIKFQTRIGRSDLFEDMIDFETDIGMPDLTYGWAKLTSEYLSRVAGQLHDLRVATYRPFSGYGEDQDLNYPFTALCERALRLTTSEFKIWGSGEQLRDFVHIDDIVAGVLSTYQTLNWNTPLNISSGVGTSFYQLAELILLAIGKEAIPIATEKNMPEGVFARVGNRNLQERYGLTLQTSLSEGVMQTLSFLDRQIK